MFFYLQALNFLHLLPFPGSLSNPRAGFGLGFPGQDVGREEGPGHGQTTFAFRDICSRDSAGLPPWRRRPGREPRRWAKGEGQARLVCVKAVFIRQPDRFFFLFFFTCTVICKSIKTANFSRNVLFTFHRREGSHPLYEKLLGSFSFLSLEWLGETNGHLGRGAETPPFLSPGRRGGNPPPPSLSTPSALDQFPGGKTWVTGAGAAQLTPGRLALSRALTGAPEGGHLPLGRPAAWARPDTPGWPPPLKF